MVKKKLPTEQDILRAKRIRYLREEIVNLSREKFGEKHNISRHSLQNWEDLRYGGLTENSAYILLQAFRAEGIDCDIDWLLYGEGIDPTAKKVCRDTNYTNMSDEAILTEELQLFYKLHPNAVDALIIDDAMQPYLSPRDRVAGERLFNNDLAKAVGLICIVQTQSGDSLVRLVQQGAATNHYSLVCSNPTLNQPTIENTKLFSAAPIIWIRKPRVIQ